jgi:hypothetical protein
LTGVEIDPKSSQLLIVIPSKWHSKSYYCNRWCFRYVLKTTKKYDLIIIDVFFRSCLIFIRIFFLVKTNLLPLKDESSMILNMKKISATKVFIGFSDLIIMFEHFLGLRPQWAPIIENLK